MSNSPMHFYCFPRPGVTIHRVSTVSADRCLDDGTPIEDLGDYIVSPVPVANPFAVFLRMAFD